MVPDAKSYQDLWRRARSGTGTAVGVCTSSSGVATIGAATATIGASTAAATTAASGARNRITTSSRVKTGRDVLLSLRGDTDSFGTSQWVFEMGKEIIRFGEMVEVIATPGDLPLVSLDIAHQVRRIIDIYSKVYKSFIAQIVECRV